MTTAKPRERKMSPDVLQRRILDDSPFESTSDKVDEIFKRHSIAEISSILKNLADKKPTK